MSTILTKFPNKVLVILLFKCALALEYYRELCSKSPFEKVKEKKKAKTKIKVEFRIHWIVYLKKTKELIIAKIRSSESWI